MNDPFDPRGAVAAVILAGGKSSRMGTDKLALAFGGETLLQRAVRRFSVRFENVAVSVADLSKYPEFGDMRLLDLRPGLGPISGLHAALSAGIWDGVFLAAADMPFACPEAAREIVRLSSGHDACVIRHPDGKLEPMFAYYGAALLPVCERHITSERFSMTRLFGVVNTRYILPDELGNLWTEKLLLNVNVPEDYEKIQKLGPHA